MNAPIFLKQPAPGVFPQDGASAARPLAIMPETAIKPVKRSKLWELKSKYHCPIIGTCLPMDELVKFARRFAFGVSLRDEFSMHTEAAGRSGTRNEMSEAIQKHLDRKYQACLRRFEQAKNDAGVLAIWREHHACGEVSGAMWAALTHKAASEETRQVVYADVHMLSHQMGAGQAADARRLIHLEKENIELKSLVEIERLARVSAKATLREELRSLRQNAAGQHVEPAEIIALRERLAAFESGQAMIDMGRRLMNLRAALEQQLIAVQRGAEMEKKLIVLDGEIRALRAERDQLAAERDALERIFISPEMPPETDNGGCDGECHSCGKRGKIGCVLYVGGRTALVAQYRSMAERLGIRLTHHDGGQGESVSRLPDMINSADAVVCPTDWVSHNAYYQLKRQCKRSGKLCVLFKGAGVSSFAAVLSNLQDPRAALAAQDGGLQQGIIERPKTFVRTPA
ncbi:MAG: DUF2325 domain-containing protein [Gallionella sp.]|nr:MAG: DUF2325 domain-containing protein [Gallionella sp.]